MKTNPISIIAVLEVFMTIKIAFNFISVSQ